MIRIHQIANADAAVTYFSKSDGYYEGGLHTEWGGKAAKELGLSGKPDYEHFKRLIHGFDPHTGEQLTALLVDNRTPGWDVTASIPKGVTVALERGDARIHDVIWEAARETMNELEAMATTRVRAGGKNEERTTGNLVWYAVEHAETRPAKNDNKADPDRHIHFVVMNITKDGVEDKWKAVKFQEIMENRKWLDRRFDSRLASKLTDLGYQIETKYKADERGGRKYFSWDIEGIPQSVVTKFSRRSQEVEDLAKELHVESALGRDKLGATSRQFKRKDMTLEDYRAYWDSRLTDKEKQEVAEAIKNAVLGLNPKPEPGAHQATRFAMEHHFERQAVVPLKQLEITALERSMGSARPEDLWGWFQAQGLLVKNGEATTKEVLEQEGRIIQFVREGKGTMRQLRARPEAGIADTATLSPFGQEKGRTEQPMRPYVSINKLWPKDTATLSPEQQAVCRHIWESRDRVLMIEGDAGTGKTHTMKTAIDGIKVPVVVLAPSSDASRNVLRRDFPEADTVASFLSNRDFQRKAKGGVIWIDEAGMLSMKDSEQVFAVAKEQGARVVLQGDRKQHGSVSRGGIMDILEEHAHLPVAKLTQVRRQSHKDYKEAVTSIAKGDILKGYDILDSLGWVKQDGLVDDYLAAKDSGKSALIVAPTHKEGDEITAEIRERLKQRGGLKDERDFQVLTPLHWSEAEKGSRDSYSGTEVIQFHRNSGGFKAGDRLRSSDVVRDSRPLRPQHFSAYEQGSISLAQGETIRFTANGWTKDRKHRIDNGTLSSIHAFTKPTAKDSGGDIILPNGWIVSKDFGHITHGYVTTSHASQGKTVDRVFVAMGSPAAVNREQFYVSVSRGRERATVYSDMAKPVLRQVIQKSAPHTSATELMRPRSVYDRGYQAVRSYMQKARQTIERLRERAVEVITPHKEPEYGY